TELLKPGRDPARVFGVLGERALPPAVTVLRPQRHRVGPGPDGLQETAGDGLPPGLLGEHLVRHLRHQCPPRQHLLPPSQAPALRQRRQSRPLPRLLTICSARTTLFAGAPVLHRGFHKVLWKTCGEWWILSAVRPEEIVGAPGARVLYSTSSGRAVSESTSSVSAPSGRPEPAMRPGVRLRRATGPGITTPSTSASM